MPQLELSALAATMLSCCLLCSLAHVRCNARRISLPQNDTSDTLLPLRVCDIAAKLGARVNLIYSCSNVAACSSAYRMEQQLHICMATLPTRTLDAEMHVLEPERNGSSLSVFILPEIPQEAELRVRQLAEWLNGSQRLKHIHKYVFVWRGATLPALTALFRALWAKHILQAIALTDSKRVYTYEPFTEHGFAVKLCAHGGDYFYDKLRNLHGFQLRISMFVDRQHALPKPQPGEGYTASDGRVAETIIKLLNATAKYISPADNQNYGACHNGTFTGALKYIVSGAAHVGFNSRFNLVCMLRGIEELYPYRRRYLYLIVPAAKMRPQYRIFMDVFTVALWGLIALNFLIVVLFFSLLQRCLHNLPVFAHLKSWRWYEILELLYKTQLGEPVAAFIRISSLREFFVAWIFFSHLLTTFYFGKLESSFVSPGYEPELDKLSELHRLNVPIYAVTNVFDAVESALEPQYWKLIEARMRALPLNYTAHPYAYNIAKRSKTKKVAFILRDVTAAEFLASTYNAHIGRPEFHAVKEYLHSMPRTYIVTRGSPFLEKLQDLVSGFYEYGFFEYWMNQDIGHRLLHMANADAFQEQFHVDDIDLEPNGGNHESTHPAQKLVVLNLDILQGAFYVWIFGLILSTFGLVLEYIHWYWNGKNRMLF